MGSAGVLPRLAVVGLCLIVLTGYTPAIGAGRAAAGCVGGFARAAAEAEEPVSDAERAETVARLNRANVLAIEAARQRASTPLPVAPDRERAEAAVAALRQIDSVERRDWYCRGDDRAGAARALASHHRFGWTPFATDRRRAWLWYSVAMVAGDRPAARERAELEPAMTTTERTEAGWMLDAWRSDPPRCRGGQT